MQTYATDTLHVPKLLATQVVGLYAHLYSLWDRRLFTVYICELISRVINLAK